MKLYLSSYRIPSVDALAKLVDKPLQDIHVALLPNAKDYYAPRAKHYKINDIVQHQKAKGIGKTSVVDLLHYRDKSKLKNELVGYDVIWAVGGNTFCLRQEMHYSGLEVILGDLLKDGIVYGGDSAGAVVVGSSLRGIESVDIPEFTEKVIYDGLGLIDKVILPHADNEFFAEANEATRAIHEKERIVELTDNQALIVDEQRHYVISALESEI